MATPPQAPAGWDTSHEIFLASARALGATIDSVGIRLDRDGRHFVAAWIPAGKSTPPRVRLTTSAGPGGPLLALGPAEAPRGGPFRGVEARARIESPAPLMIRLETEIDRTGKTMRINRETQTGDRAFDDRVYLESEAPDAVVLGVLVDPSMRASALKCLELGCTSVELDRDGNLVVVLPFAGAATTSAEFLGSVLDTLGATADAIPPLQRKARRRSIAAGIPVISFVSAVVSLPVFFLVDWLWKPLGSDLYGSSAFVGLVLWLIALPILFFVLRGRSVSLRDLVTCGFSLLLAMPLGATDLMLTINGLFDTSAPIVHETRVTDLRKTTGKNTRYHVTVGSWHPGETTINMSIDSSLFSRLSGQTEVSVTTSPGSLGWERLLDITPR